MSESSRLQNLSHPRIGPLFVSPKYSDTKDPCAVFDGKLWHMYGSGGSSAIERWHILHATAKAPEGPWKVQKAAKLEGITGGGVAAPSVEYDPAEKVFHMFVQTHYAALGSTIEHLVSSDGHYFKYKDTPLTSIPGTDEAGIYDPHAAVLSGEKYISYSGFPRVGRPDVYLAKSSSNSWYGPWQRLGKILSHHEISHHNQHDHPDYEWGLEGTQLLQLPNGTILMNAVCFLPQGLRGTRQRVFFSVARKPEGPYLTLGPILNPQNNEWESGENGHAAGYIIDNELLLFYQARAQEEGRNKWRYGLVKYDTRVLEELAEERFKEFENQNAIVPNDAPSPIAV
jgi:hypothetical protein